MQMFNKFLMILILAGLASCATQPTDEARIAALCESYAATLSGLATIKQQMTRQEIETIDNTRQIINPICRSRPSNNKQALIAISQALPKLLTVEQKYDTRPNQSDSNSD